MLFHAPVGKRNVVAAGSVVTSSIQDDKLWGENSSKFIRKLNTEVYDSQT